MTNSPRVGEGVSASVTLMPSAIAIGLIGEATHLLQLTRAYLDDVAEPGLRLALD